jgi:hypothetical protein
VEEANHHPTPARSARRPSPSEGRVTTKRLYAHASHMRAAKVSERSMSSSSM